MSSPAVPISGDFEDSADVALDYNVDGTINTITYTKFVDEFGVFTKTYTFTYDTGKVVAIDVEVAGVT